MFFLKQTFKFATRNTLFGYFGKKVSKNLCYVQKFGLAILPKWKISSKRFIHLFIYLFWGEQQKWKTIVIIEITKLEFVRIKSFI